MLFKNFSAISFFLLIGRLREKKTGLMKEKEWFVFEGEIIRDRYFCQEENDFHTPFKESSEKLSFSL
jgi:hypothetical protein